MAPSPRQKIHANFLPTGACDDPTQIPRIPVLVSAMFTETVTQAEPTLSLRAENVEEEEEDTYKYAHLLPHFSRDKYPPLIPFEHVDPGSRALNHQDPRAFLKGATSVIALTPNLGTEVRGIPLRDLDNDGRDQIALEVSTAPPPESQCHILSNNRLLDVD